MTTFFLALWWPELTGFTVVLLASLWITWAFSFSVIPSLIVGVPFGCGVGMGVAEVERRRNR